jgi:hypothetical protein
MVAAATVMTTMTTVAVVVVVAVAVAAATTTTIKIILQGRASARPCICLSDRRAHKARPNRYKNAGKPNREHDSTHD